MLKPATLTDLDFFYGLYMHPEINPYLLYDPMPHTEFMPVYEDLLEKDVLYVFIANGIPSGMCKIIPQCHRNSHMLYLGGVAIHPGHRGMGLGLQMMQEIIAFAVGRGIHRIELSTATSNSIAIRLYERVGFKIEGCLRDFTWLKNDNRYLDEYVMSWIAE